MSQDFASNVDFPRSSCCQIIHVATRRILPGQPIQELPPPVSAKAPFAMTSDLKSRWVALYTLTLPTLARSKAKSQSTWPVHLDHCFARIILDTVIGNSTSTRPDESPTPWTAKLKSPAVKNMSTQQLEACVELGEAIAEGKIDLVELDQRSLMVRGKMLTGEKRKREEEGSPGLDGARERGMKKFKISSARSQQSDIRAAMGAPPPTPPKSPSPAPVDPAVSREIASHPTLTPLTRPARSLPSAIGLVYYVSRALEPSIFLATRGGECVRYIFCPKKSLS